VNPADQNLLNLMTPVGMTSVPLQSIFSSSIC